MRAMAALLAGLTAGCLAEGRLEVEIEQGLPVYRVEVAVVRGHMPNGNMLDCGPFLSGEVKLEDARLELDYHESFYLEREPYEAPTIGRLEPGAALFVVRAWNRECQIAGNGCVAEEVASGRDAEVAVPVLRLEPPQELCDGPVPCLDSVPQVGDADGDGHLPAACGGDDCNDADPERWTGHADLDRDGHPSALCGGDDCNDADPERWTGHADLDGDGHDAASCGGDDCDDAEPLWRDADLDDDGRASEECGGDDCDDDGDGTDSVACGGSDCNDADASVPSCEGRECGDGCGGSCPPGCGADERCRWATGMCVPSADWTEVTVASSPSARREHSMAYDSVRGVVVLFGGYEEDSGLLADTWEYDGTGWVHVSPPSSPPVCVCPLLTYDSAREVVVLLACADRPQTWEYNGTNWTDVTPALSPQVLDGAAMAYDSAREVVVLFGGYASGGVFLEQTWEYDGEEWADVSPASSPPALANHAMVYDSGRGAVVIFGGVTDGPFYLGGTWEHDGHDWAQGTASRTPPARADLAMAYDAARGAVVLFGGGVSAMTRFGTVVWETFGDTWEYSP